MVQGKKICDRLCVQHGFHFYLYSNIFFQAAIQAGRKNGWIGNVRFFFVNCVVGDVSIDVFFRSSDELQIFSNHAVFFRTDHPADQELIKN
jgi:hypothetical protein